MRQRRGVADPAAGHAPPIRGMVRALGDRLYREGYRGCFCFDFLIGPTTATSISARSIRTSAAPAR
jgi:hypothetical protein